MLHCHRVTHERDSMKGNKVARQHITCKQLVCYLKSNAVWVGRIVWEDDQLVGLCMEAVWGFWSCMVMLHGVVGGAYKKYSQKGF